MSSVFQKLRQYTMCSYILIEWNRFLVLVRYYGELRVGGSQPMSFDPTSACQCYLLFVTHHNHALSVYCVQTETSIDNPLDCFPSQLLWPCHPKHDTIFCPASTWELLYYWGHTTICYGYRFAISVHWDKRDHPPRSRHVQTSNRTPRSYW